ncbi:hypothetical protein BDV27DRAFT_172122 [Aspergillus caelatus]|uniref:Kelch repeat protein n=1 Tax=Aspergillus caelatus TaxID=61420 RepID=A0A5N7A5Q6_9EURO|nr:uncharacterized protein BDV27DRAFT_172122 [Aspergillus caelatus]KAE8364758.1 hypothetical protein BDV27DRAFT_172122 [Aspergillus caelatus]
MAGVVLFALYLYILTQCTIAAETNCSRIFHSVDDLETIDLTKSWVNSDSDLYTYIPKPLANHTAIYLDEGAAWSDGETLFFYGGYVSGVNGPSVPPLGTWKYNIASNEWTHSGFSGAALNSMEMVRVYDIAEQKWYTQQTSGDIPGWRMSGCTVVAPAQDLSSYSIIRIKHKCVRPQNNTMIVVGGNTPVTNREYDPLPQNCDSATFANGIGIFDLHSLSWLSNYNASYNDAYRIPSKVSDVIGGSETGGATVVSPKDGFNSTSMEDLFKKRNNVTDSGTSSTSAPGTTGQSSGSSKESLSGGGIAGVTIGCVAGVGLIAGLAWFLTRRHRKAKAASSSRLAWQSDASAIPPPDQSPRKELYGSGPEVHEMGVRDQPRFEMPAENMAVEMPAEGIKR